MRTLLVGATTLILAMNASCFALTLDEARKKGLVCEKSDGLLKNVSGTSEVDDFITQINYERLQKYKQVANDKGASLAATQQIFGQQLQGQYGGC